MQRLPLGREMEEKRGGVVLYRDRSTYAKGDTRQRQQEQREYTTSGHQTMVHLIVAGLSDGPLVSVRGWPWRLPDCQQEASGKSKVGRESSRLNMFSRLNRRERGRTREEEKSMQRKERGWREREEEGEETERKRGYQRPKKKRGRKENQDGTWSQGQSYLGMRSWG